MNIFKWLFNPDWFTFYAGGGGGPTQTTSYQTNIPEYAQPYVEQMLGATQRQLFTGSTDASGQFKPTGFQNYIPYGSTFKTDAQGNPVTDTQGRVVYTNTPEQQARAAVAPMSTNQNIAAAGISNYNVPGQTQAASRIAGDVAGRAAVSGAYSPFNAGLLRYDPSQTIRTDSYTSPYTSQGYMSPYMQNVVNAQQREARRQSDIMGNQNRAQAMQAGAFGGSRQAIMEAERQRNLATQLGDIQGTGLQQAYQQGQQQFNQEQANYMQAQQANQQATQQARQMEEQSRQFGANLGLQGYGQTLQAAQLLGAQGAQKFQQDMAKLQAQYDIGAKQQAQQQALINQQMQNYATAQQYPLMQLGVMSNMLRGLPMQASTTQMYQAQPSMLAQGAGAIGTGLGIYQQGQKAGVWKEGGTVKLASGGIATGVPEGKLQSWAKDMSDKDINGKMQDQETDAATKEVMGAEMARRQRLRAGMPKMAAGGIVAFKKGKEVKEEDAPPVSDTYPEEFDRGTAAGIAQAPAPEKPAAGIDAEQSLLDQQAKLQKYQEQQKGLMEKSPTQVIEERKKAREAQGMPSPYNDEAAKIQAQRTTALAGEKEQAQDRLITFLQRWGSLPGPTLVSLNRAGMEMIEKSDMDRKEQRRLLASLDKSESEIKRAEYLRQIGEEEKAQQAIEKAGVEYHRVGKEIVDNAVKLINAKASNEAKTEIARLQRELAEAKGASSSDYKVRLKTIADRLKMQKEFANAPEAVVMEAADKIIRGHEISKASAGAAQSVPVREREAATHERIEATKSAKDVEAMVDEAVDRDPGKRAARAADRKSGTSAEMDKIRKKHEDAIRAKISGTSASAAPASSSSSPALKWDPKTNDWVKK